MRLRSRLTPGTTSAELFVVPSRPTPDTSICLGPAMANQRPEALQTSLKAVKLTAQQQSDQVEGLIDLICSYAGGELDVHHIREEATSLRFIYLYTREHYGVKRTGRQMMQKMSILQRRPGERLNALWNRTQGFWAENRIRQGDEIKITDSSGQLKTATEDETGDRYRLSSDLVLCLYMAHPELPSEVEKLLSGKLEHQDVASLLNQKVITLHRNKIANSLEC